MAVRIGKAWRTPQPAPFGPGSAVCLLAGMGLCLLLSSAPARMLSIAVVVAGGLAWRHGDARRWLGACAIGFGVCGWHAASVLAGQLPAPLEQRMLVVEGRVSGLPDVQARRTRFHLDIDRGPAELVGKTVQLMWHDARDADTIGPRAHLHAGERWKLAVKLRRPRGLRNPGGFDAERHAFATGVAATGSVADDSRAVRLQSGRGIDAWREDMSRRIGASMASPMSRFVRALALGDTTGLDDADWTVLRATGLTHLIAISGFHVGLVAGFFALLVQALWWCWPALGKRWPRPIVAALAAFAGAALYTAVAGFALPTLRTTAMIGVIALVRASRRPASTVDAVALAAILLLLFDPLGMLTAGFWLSFGGVVWLIWCLPPERGNPLGQFLAAQWVATLGLLPLTVLWFGQASAAGSLANLLAVPWWSLVVVPLSLLGVLADTLWQGTGVWLWKASAVAFSWSWPLFSWLAKTRFAFYWLAEPHMLAWPLALLGVFWMLMPRGTPGRWLGVVLLLPMLWPDRQLPKHGLADMLVVDVGQGLAVLVRTRHHALLYDAGPAIPHGFDAGERAVLPALHASGVRRLDAAIISHGDSDHAGGFAAVRAGLPVRTAYGPQDTPTPGTRPCVAGMQWQWDGVRFRILHPTPHFPYLKNESSCVLRVETAAGAYLLLGDIGEIIERRLVRSAKADLRADVVVVGHHGSAGSSDPALVQATGASLALVSSGHRNRFRHPHPSVVRRWRQAGAEVANTASLGALRVRLQDDHIMLRGQRTRWRRMWDAERGQRPPAELSYGPFAMTNPGSGARAGTGEGRWMADDSVVAAVGGRAGDHRGAVLDPAPHLGVAGGAGR